MNQMISKTEETDTMLLIQEILNWPEWKIESIYVDYSDIKLIQEIKNVKNNDIDK